jgi:hypothetical protein
MNMIKLKQAELLKSLELFAKIGKISQFIPFDLFASLLAISFKHLFL